jgi:excisionase family DNA binding protein
MHKHGTTFMYSPQNAAEFLGIGRTKVYHLLDSGELESINIGRCRRIPLTSLREYINIRLAA